MKNKKALILAGGLGTRIIPVSHYIPKPLIPVRGKPIIERIINRLKKFGFDDIYVALNYKASEFKVLKRLKGVRLTFLKEKERLGTAGPLAMLKNLGFDESVLVINGDVLTDLDFGRFYQQHEKWQADLTVGMIKYTDSLRFGILKLDKKRNIKGITEKPVVMTYEASAGIYLIKKRAADLVPKKIFTMPELIEKAIKKRYNVKGYLIKGRWMAIEEIKDLESGNNARKGDWISRL